MIICCNCKTRMFVTGVENVGVPVLVYSAAGQPYQILWGDRATCDKCGFSVLTNFSTPIYHHQEEFKNFLPGLQNNPNTVEVK